MTPADLEHVKRLAAQKARGFRSNRYIDSIISKVPVSPKQRRFLGLDQYTEVMFGGAGGGGKTFAICLAALQYFDVKGYSAIIFRDTYKNLTGEGAPLTRLRQMLSPWIVNGEVHWSSTEAKFISAEGGVIACGYMEHENDAEKYMSWEFQGIFEDEVTQIKPVNYQTIFARLRRPAIPCKHCFTPLDRAGNEWTHQDAVVCQNPVPDPATWEQVGALYSVPLRVRCASNPGGLHGEFYRDLFVPNAYLTAEPDVQFSRLWEKSQQCDECGATGQKDDRECIYCQGRGVVSRIFVPSRLSDNPYLDRNAYRRSLQKMTESRRLQLEHGRWDVGVSGNVFFQTWLQYYAMRGDVAEMRPGSDHPSLSHSKIVMPADLMFFVTADTAIKTKTVNDPTVMCVWAMTPDYHLLLWDVVRDRIPVPDLLKLLLQLYRQYNCKYAIIEDASSGSGLLQELSTERGRGVNTIPYKPGNQDKVTRSVEAQIRCRNGQVWLPNWNPHWLSSFVSEIISFNGDSDAHDDQVDNLSMACWWAAQGHRLTRISSGRPAEQVVGGVEHPRLGGRF